MNNKFSEFRKKILKYILNVVCFMTFLMIPIRIMEAGIVRGSVTVVAFFVFLAVRLYLNKDNAKWEIVGVSIATFLAIIQAVVPFIPSEGFTNTGVWLIMITTVQLFLVSPKLYLWILIYNISFFTGDVLYKHSLHSQELDISSLIQSVFACSIIVLFFRYILKSLDTSFLNLVEKNNQLSISEEKLSQKASQLKESNERLEEFAYITSHDLKAPIRGAKSLIEFTLEDFETELPKEAISNLNKAKESMVKMNTLVMDLLAFSKADKIELSFKNCDLNELIKEISEKTEKDQNSTISFSKLPTVYVDVSRLREVFYNIISNGLKYNQSKNKTIELGFNKESKSLWIKDNGIGIAKENHYKIFKFFQRLHTNKEYEGTGTGLALVKRILDRHQINISIESSLGNGTTFTLDLSNCLVD